MSIQELKTQLTRLILNIAPEADMDNLDPNADLREELDLDSIDFLRLLSSIDKELAVNIPESDYAEVTSLQALAAYISKYRANMGSEN